MFPSHWIAAVLTFAC